MCYFLRLSTHYLAHSLDMQFREPPTPHTDLSTLIPTHSPLILTILVSLFSFKGLSSFVTPRGIGEEAAEVYTVYFPPLPASQKSPGCYIAGTCTFHETYCGAVQLVVLVHSHSRNTNLT